MDRYLILGATLAFASVVQPGPLQAYLVSQVARNGWKRALPAALSPLLSDGPIIALVLLVLSRMPAAFAATLQIGGGAFLLFLAARAYRNWRRFDQVQPAAETDRRRTVLQGVVVNLLNPSPYLGWSLVLGPLLLEGWRVSPAHGLALVVGFYGTMVGGLVATILLAGAAGSVGSRVNRSLVGLSALALAGFGVYQLGSGLTSLRP